MAKRQKDLDDWNIIFDEPAESEISTPSRRSRRAAQTSQSLSLKLERESDETRLEVGDCVLLSGSLKNEDASDNSYVAIVVDILLGNKNFLDIQALPFVSVSEIPLENRPSEASENRNEVFITSELEFIKLANFVEKVQVLSEEEFCEVVVDVSSSSTYLCRRGCDRFQERFSETFDYRDWHKLLAKNAKEAVKFVAEKTRIIISPNKAKSSSKSLQQRLQVADTPLKKRYAESSEDDDDPYDEDEESDDNVMKEEEDDEEEIAEEVENLPEKKKEPKKKQRKPKSESGTPSPKKRQRRDPNSVKHLQDVLSPLKKGFKVKSGASASSLPSLSTPICSPALSATNTASEAFKELRERLHTSTKLNFLPCREDQYTEVLTYLEDAIQNQLGCCIYVSGTPGVGKTATIREVVRDLTEIADQDMLNKFDFLEINCLKLLTPNSAYEKLWEYLSGIKVTPSNAALLLEEFFSRDTSDENRKPLVVLMDELDQIVTKSQSVMYNFFNWPTYPNSKLIIIAVANTMDLPERMLSNKIASRLGLRRVPFVGYTFQQLGIIIKNRLQMLKEQNRRKVTIGEDAVGFASRKVASVSGDARRALAICRRAVEIAEQDYLDSVDTEGVPEEEQTFSILISHISKAINETVNSPLAQLIASLSFASKLILVGVLLRMRRSGLAENSLGDIIDEIKNSLSLVTTKESSLALKGISETATIMDLLYGTNLFTSTPNKSLNIRIFAMAQLVNELVEYGILIQQNVRSERYRLITLNVSEDDILTVLRKDKTIASML